MATPDLEAQAAIKEVERIIQQHALGTDQQLTRTRRGPLQWTGDLIERLADIPIANFNPDTLWDEEGGFRLGNLIPPLGAAAMIRRSWRERQTLPNSSSETRF